MLIETAINKAREQEAEKVAISLKVPSEIKTKLQSIADGNSVSLNNLCVSILESVLDGKLDSQGTMELVRHLDDAKKILEEATGYLNNGIDSLDTQKGTTIDFNVEKMIATAKIAGISSELNRRAEKMDAKR